MKVARHPAAAGLPGMWQKKVTVPEGRCEPRYPMYCVPQVEERPVDPIIPSLRDGSFSKRFPGTKVPGYHHSVPSSFVVLNYGGQVGTTTLQRSITRRGRIQDDDE